MSFGSEMREYREHGGVLSGFDATRTYEQKVGLMSIRIGVMKGSWREPAALYEDRVKDPLPLEILGDARAHIKAIKSLGVEVVNLK